VPFPYFISGSSLATFYPLFFPRVIKLGVWFSTLPRRYKFPLHASSPPCLSCLILASFLFSFSQFFYISCWFPPSHQNKEVPALFCDMCETFGSSIGAVQFVGLCFPPIFFFQNDLTGYGLSANLGVSPPYSALGCMSLCLFPSSLFRPFTFRHPPSI